MSSFSNLWKVHLVPEATTGLWLMAPTRVTDDGVQELPVECVINYPNREAEAAAWQEALNSNERKVMEDYRLIFSDIDEFVTVLHKLQHLGQKELRISTTSEGQYELTLVGIPETQLPTVTSRGGVVKSYIFDSELTIHVDPTGHHVEDITCNYYLREG